MLKGSGAIDLTSENNKVREDPFYYVASTT